MPDPTSPGPSAPEPTAPGPVSPGPILPASAPPAAASPSSPAAAIPPDPTRDDDLFDAAVIRAAFAHAGLRGWGAMSLVEAAQDTGLDLTRLRRRFPSKQAVLIRFGVLADAAALTGISAGEAPRERLFDMLMNRFEALQAHREGVLALLVAVRRDPLTGLLLYGETLRSMRWLLDAAGIGSDGVTGQLRTHGLMALWLYALRAWSNDDSLDLSGTMAAVDRGLDRAMQAERSMPWRAPAPPVEEFEEPPIL